LQANSAFQFTFSFLSLSLTQTNCLLSRSQFDYKQTIKMKYEQHCSLLMVQPRHHRALTPSSAAAAPARSRTTMFQCTWRHCGFESGHREEMLQHVRKQHMG
jgi:hypothetical protein